ncbi:unnamed protein product [Spirodela intermedia]|uniref:N-alpha-acetyltransferase 40 n=1 Tax=Spirodela intermedia TaxID=51605 RepID=A0A7I8KFC0_SPIIN|nr:unnamed protein product [Spirodela intermedia]
MADSSKGRKIKRKEVLERKKAITEVIKTASAVKDHLAPFLPFRQYDRNDLAVYLESGYGSRLSTPMKQYIQALLKINMEKPYGAEWSVEEKVKRREMVAPEAQYLFIREAPAACGGEDALKCEEKSSHHLWTGDGDPVVGFVHYRFTIEEDIPVIYVYELQLESHVRGKGLGKFLMQLIELIARKNHMGAVMLTVQKSNESAMNFYTNKLRYHISIISPSRVDPLIGGGESYEILCKVFNAEAKTKMRSW